MAQVVYRGNLNAASFPLVSLYQGQSVVVREQDNNYVPSVSSKADEDKDIGIPQIYYCHNVVPTNEGLSSIGFSPLVAPVLGVTTFSQVFTLRDVQSNRVLLGVTTDGRQFVVTEGEAEWTELPSIPGTANKLVTTSFVNGITYVYFSTVGCYKYNFTTNLLESVVLTGLDLATILGITGNSGYLLAWSKDGIAWSSTVDPTDFVPSLETGAGGGGVEGAEGAITCLVPTVAGLVVYTEVNAVACSYSGNARFPFNFRKIIGCGGLGSPEFSTVEGSNGTQYAYTTFGLQTVSLQQAQIALPQVTDFLSGSLLEDFNEVDREFTYQSLSEPMRKKIALVSGRYLIMSYGVTGLTHALYYDASLKRMGKLKINHVDITDLSQYTSDIGVEAAKRSIGIIQANGAVFRADTDFLTTNGYGILVTGKYQYRRSRFLDLHTVILENCTTSGYFALRDLYAIDGKNNMQQEGYLLSNEGLQRKYGFSTSAINHSLLYEGNFALNSLVMTFSINGRIM